MKTKLYIIILAVYGVIITTAYHIHSQQVHESGLFLFNFIVEKYIIPPILLYFANDVGNSIIGNNLLALRILVSIAFWGGIPSGIFLLMRRKIK
jgi:hypothetical protein